MDFAAFVFVALDFVDRDNFFETIFDVVSGNVDDGGLLVLDGDVLERVSIFDFWFYEP